MRPLRHGFNAYEIGIARQIEALAGLARNSIQDASDGFRLRVTVYENGNTDEALWSWECDSYIQGLSYVARELGIAFADVGLPADELEGEAA